MPHLAPHFTKHCTSLCVTQVFARLDADLNTALALEATRAPQLNVRRATTHREVKDSANVSLTAFRATYGKEEEPIRDGSLTFRLHSMSNAVKAFETTSQASMPTGWSMTRLPVVGMASLNLKHRQTMRDVTKLCNVSMLAPPSGFVKSHSYHYGKYHEDQLISFLSASVMNMNNMPGSVCVVIDLAASIDTNHSMSIAIDSIKKLLRKRRNPCALFAQVAQTDIASAFWGGKLTKTRRASVLAALIHSFDERYTIYEDTDDMAIFFE